MILFRKCPYCHKVRPYGKTKDVIPQYGADGYFEGFIVKCKNCGKDFKIELE